MTKAEYIKLVKYNEFCPLQLSLESQTSYFNSFLIKDHLRLRSTTPSSMYLPFCIEQESIAIIMKDCYPTCDDIWWSYK